MAATIGIAAGEANVRWALKTSEGAVKYGTLADGADLIELVASIERKHRISLKHEAAVRVADSSRPGVIGALRDGGYQPIPVPAGTAAWAGIFDSMDLPREGYLLVCDFGSAAVRYVLVDASDGAVLQQVTDTSPSGAALDQAIASYLYERSLSLAPIQQGDLQRAAQRLKEALSSSNSAVIDVGGERVALTTEELDRIAAPIVAASFAGIARTLSGASAAVTAIALVGAGAQLPFLVELASDWFRVPVLRPIESEFAVVHGLVAESQIAGSGARGRRFPVGTLVTAAAISVVAAVGVGLFLASEVNSQWDSIVRDRQGAVTVPQRDSYPWETDRTRIPRTEWMATLQPPVEATPTATAEPTADEITMPPPSPTPSPEPAPTEDPVSSVPEQVNTPTMPPVTNEDPRARTRSPEPERTRQPRPPRDEPATTAPPDTDPPALAPTDGIEPARPDRESEGPDRSNNDASADASETDQ